MAKPKNTASEEEVKKETPEERAERKAAEPKGPVAKPKAQLQRPDIKSLYPWAANRRKAETAHIAVHNSISEEVRAGGKKPSAEDTEQRVMDHYTLHGGLVIGQEKATVVGRKRAIKVGATTDEVIHDEVDDEDED